MWYTIILFCMFSYVYGQVKKTFHNKEFKNQAASYPDF